jgi:hypothetical protein
LQTPMTAIKLFKTERIDSYLNDPIPEEEVQI